MLVVFRVDEYNGDYSSLHVKFHSERNKRFPDYSKEMWGILEIKNGEVKNDLTDYGYKSKEQAVEVARNNAKEGEKVIF